MVPRLWLNGLNLSTSHIQICKSSLVAYDYGKSPSYSTTRLNEMVQKKFQVLIPIQKEHVR